MILLLIASLFTSQTVAQTPQDCLKAGRDFAAKRMKELGPTTGDTVRQVTAERLTMLRECAAQFDASKTPPAALAALIELYTEAQQLDLARAAVTRALGDKSLEPATRADLLAMAVRTKLREPKSAERNAAAERYLEELDALGDSALEQRFTAHNALNNYYRGDDIDAGIITHSTWMLEAAKKFNPDQRRRFANVMINAYINLAEAVAGHGENDRAIELLKRAPGEWPESSYGADRVKDTLARYLLVGGAAPSVSAPLWLNRTTPGPLDLKGKVTLLQFTAHWCGPCKESYPGMKRLEDRFAKDGLQVVFYTRTYGYFEQDRNLTAEQEIERDKKYFAGYGFTLPIAIGPPSTIIVDGKHRAQEDPVEKSFEVGGIPQINVIDRKGTIRLVMIGYDDANEERLAALIKTLLADR